MEINFRNKSVVEEYMLFNKKQYLSEYKSNVEKYTDVLVKKITELTQQKFNEEIQLIDFEAFIDPFTVSIIANGMDRDATQYLYDEDLGKDLFCGNFYLLEEANYYSLPEDTEDEFWDFYENNDEELSSAEEKILAEWFAHCWNKASGNSIGLPSYFCLHDYENSYDLTNKKWIDSEDKWEE